MFFDERKDLFLMVYLTFTYAAITRMCLQIKDPKYADSKRFKIGMHLEKREKIMTAWEDLDNPNFPHILFTSVIMCNCDESVITKSHMLSWFVITPFSSPGRNN